MDKDEINNSLSSLVTSLYHGGALGAYSQNGTQMMQSDTMFINNRWYLISNFRQLLSEMYVEHGIVQTLVDQPVDDAFRSGFEMQTSEIDKDDIEQVEVYLERHRIIDTIMQALKWGRLYGGGGILIITEDKPDEPLDINKINSKSKIEFKAVDMWELYDHEQNVQGNTEVGDKLQENNEYYHYYGKRIHKSRVYRIEGKQAPSFIRPRLRGWGMSELEKVVASINSYMKNQNVIFELLDEAKVDVYKIKGFNSALMTAGGTNGVSKRIQHANMIKNYNSALTMDVEDAYEQKQVAFTGLSEILTQIRQGLAADLKMPMTKLFGISSAGFNSGEDDIENYNAMIEGEIRSKVKYIVVDLLSLVCRKVLDFAPEDLQIEFSPLRILNAKEEEEVKNNKYNRLLSAYQVGGINPRDFKEGLNRENLLPIEIEENDEALMPLDENYLTKEGDGVDGS